MSKTKRITTAKLFTPAMKVRYIGLAEPYFHVRKPGQDDGKEQKGMYSITLVAEPGEISDFISKMEAIHEELYDKLCTQEGKKLKKDDPYSALQDELDKDLNPTGNVLVRLSHADRGFNPKNGKRWEILPKVVDAKAQLLEKDVYSRIGWGSVVRCSFTARPALVQGKAKIVYDLSATQLLVPEWFDGNQANDFEGQEVEEGYVHATAPEGGEDF